MHADLLITGGRVVAETAVLPRGYVLVRAGRIVSIGAGDPAAPARARRRERRRDRRRDGPHGAAGPHRHAHPRHRRRGLHGSRRRGHAAGPAPVCPLRRHGRGRHDAVESAAEHHPPGRPHAEGPRGPRDRRAAPGHARGRALARGALPRRPRGRVPVRAGRRGRRPTPGRGRRRHPHGDLRARAARLRGPDRAPCRAGYRARARPYRGDLRAGRGRDPRGRPARHPHVRHHARLPREPRRGARDDAGHGDRGPAPRRGERRADRLPGARARAVLPVPRQGQAPAPHGDRQRLAGGHRIARGHGAHLRGRAQGVRREPACCA